MDATDFFAWQGLELSLPAGWRPVKIGGDETAGEVLFADVDRPLMGVRWDTPGRGARRDPDGHAARLLRGQVGQLSAARAKPFPMPTGDWAASLLFEEPDPPGRDVWVGLSRATGRSVEIALHRHEPADRGRLAMALLPTLVDVPLDRSRRWRLFDLDVRVPPGHRLTSHKLSAGDLSLSFTRDEPIGRGRVRRLPLTLRQIRPARLALSRRTLAEWLQPFAWQASRFHKPAQPPEATAHGLVQPWRRRRRYGWLWTVPRALTARIDHDARADRLLLLRGVPEAVAEVTFAAGNS